MLVGLGVAHGVLQHDEVAAPVIEGVPLRPQSAAVAVDPRGVRVARGQLVVAGHRMDRSVRRGRHPLVGVELGLGGIMGLVARDQQEVRRPAEGVELVHLGGEPRLVLGEVVHTELHVVEDEVAQATIGTAGHRAKPGVSAVRCSPGSSRPRSSHSRAVCASSSGAR